MNEVLKAIAGRRCVRDYEKKQVSREVIETIINAGNQAPSAMNSQPWRFVVAEKEDFRRKLTSAAVPNALKLIESFKSVDPVRYDMILKRFRELEDPVYYSAPVIIFVIGAGSFADSSCALACENMMLAAFSLGIGSCWIHFGSLVTEDPEIRRALELKPDEEIYGPLIFGYPKEWPQPPVKKAPSVKWI